MSGGGRACKEGDELAVVHRGDAPSLDALLQRRPAPRGPVGCGAAGPSLASAAPAERSDVGALARGRCEYFLSRFGSVDHNARATRVSHLPIDRLSCKNFPDLDSLSRSFRR